MVGLIAGLMFATNASLFATTGDERHPQNLAELVKVERDRLDDTNTDVEELRDEVTELVDSQDSVSEPSVGLQIASGRMPVTGPGVTVKLWDAPMRDPLPDGVSADDLIIHQQDLEAVINGMWAGGAEAMSVQGHRVTSRSSIRCVGNVLLIDGSVYSPPYEISAIGDERSIESALMSSPQVQTYLDYVDALQLGWSMESSDSLEFDADSGISGVSYAALPGEDPIRLPSDVTPPSPTVTEGNE